MGNFDAAKNYIYKAKIAFLLVCLFVLYEIFPKDFSSFPPLIIMLEEKTDYLINPSETICGKNKGKDFLIVSFIPSGINYFERRQNVRNTWANQTYEQHKLIKTIFLVGLSLNESINHQLKKESETYKDILQINFTDSYKILINKTINGIKWMLAYCGNAKFIMKVDDDIVVNTKSLVEYFLALNSTSSRNKIYGKCMHNFTLPIRDINDKHFISTEDYSPAIWPNYCLGPAYILASDTLKPIYNLSKYIRQFPMEDTYVGLLAKELKIDLIDVKNWLIENYPPIWIDSELNEIANITDKYFLFISIVDPKYFYLNWNIIFSKYFTNN